MIASLRVGVAVGGDVIAARWGTSHWQCALTSGPTPDGLSNAASELKRLLERSRRISVSMAVLPPLAQVKRIELPRMSDEDRRLAVLISIQRHFIGVDGVPLCAVAGLKGAAGVSSAPFLAAAISAALIDDLTTAFVHEGFSIERIVPAHAAWISAVTIRRPALRRGKASIGVYGHGEDTMLGLDAGSLVCVRRFRRSEMATLFARTDHLSDAELIGADMEGPSAAIVAARGAVATCLLEIISDAERRGRISRERRLSRLLLALACSCLVGAAMSYRWGLARELSVIAARRTAVHSRAEKAIAARDSAQQLAAVVAAFANLERSAPRWSAVLSQLALALPEDADLTSLRAADDSVTLEGQAGNAARVFSVLRSVPGVRSAGTTTPVRRETSARETPLELWSVALRVDHDAALTKR
jgi:Tfp pilus assembly protein PilN